MPINTELALKVWSRYQFCRDNGHTAFTQKADKCERFFSGDQWDKRDLAKLRSERRPALTINKILPTVGSVMGEQIKNRAEVSFRPRAPQFDDTAAALNKVFKQIADQNQLIWTRSQMFDDGVITSRGFIDVRMDYSRSLKGDVKYTNLNPKNVVVDPDAEQYDPDTWSEVFTTKWVTADDVAVLYGSEDAELLRRRGESFFPYGYDSITDGRDRFGNSTTPGYADRTDMGNVQRNIRLIERQYRKMDRQKFFVNTRTGDMRPVPEGWDRDRIALIVKEFGFQVLPQVVRRIRWSVIADCVELHDDWSPYEHFTVVPYFPYFRHGHTIGLVENLLDPQELLNKTTSQELHIVNSSANGGYKVKQGTLTNMTLDELEANGAKTGIVIEVAGDPDKDVVKIQPNQVPQGLDRLSYKAEEAIKSISNVSDSALGQDRADVAAKAIQEKKQSGQITMVKPLDNLARTDFFLARATLSLVQRFYSDERLVMFTNDEARGTQDSITVNQVTPEGTIMNDLTIGEYDVVVTSVPVKDTSEDSEFDQAISLKELGIAIPDEVIIQASRLQDKKAVLEKMAQRAQSPEAQQQAAAQLQLVQAEVEKLHAEIERIKAQAAKDVANAQAIGVKAQKEAATPIEQGQADTTHIDEAKAGHEMDLAERKFQHEAGLKEREHELKAQTAAQDAQLKAKAQQDQADQARIAALTKPEPAEAATAD